MSSAKVMVATGSNRTDHERVEQQRGAGLAEYALLLLLIALASVVALTAFGVRVAAMFNSIGGMF